ncbi:potassium channel family protein [Aeromicrobium fastidiosum]|nr:potassium channel family protein [Aeromicrobium fastidiosum]
MTVAGVTVVLFVLTDMFHTLANPGALGRLSRTMLRLTWTLSSRNRLSGPLAMLAVVMIWGVLAVLGWAAVYWPHMDYGFSHATEHGSGPGALDAVYVSLVTISTLGLGDVLPTSAWLRLVNPLEALFGFALLTVAVSWVLQVFPTLARRRELALRLVHLQEAGTVDLLGSLDRTVVHSLLTDLAASVTRVRVDLHDYPETYYFREPEDVGSLAEAIPVASRLVEAARTSTVVEVRHGGAVLGAALDDLAEVLQRSFLRPCATTDEALRVFLADHSSGGAAGRRPAPS